jgi:hypothetical protein
MLGAANVGALVAEGQGGGSICRIGAPLLGGCDLLLTQEREGRSAISQVHLYMSAFGVSVLSLKSPLPRDPANVVWQAKTDSQRRVLFGTLLFSSVRGAALG